jgi:hypothetical protein
MWNASQIEPQTGLPVLSLIEKFREKQLFFHQRSSISTPDVVHLYSISKIESLRLELFDVMMDTMNSPLYCVSKLKADSNQTVRVEKTVEKI